MFYWIVLIQLACCSFRFTHSLYSMHSSSQQHTHIHTNKCNQVTYVLMLYQLLNWKHITHNYILLYLLQQIHLCNRAVMNVLKIEQYGKNINLYSDSNDDMSNSHHTGLSQFNIRISKKIQFRSRIDPGSRIWSNKLLHDTINWCMHTFSIDTDNNYNTITKMNK